MIQLNLHILPEHSAQRVDVEVRVTSPGNPSVPAGTLMFTHYQWIVFLDALLRGADHRDSFLNVSLQADNLTFNLSNAIVRIPWVEPDDHWMYRTGELSLYGEGQRDRKKKAQREV